MSPLKLQSDGFWFHRKSSTWRGRNIASRKQLREIAQPKNVAKHFNAEAFKRRDVGYELTQPPLAKNLRTRQLGFLVATDFFAASRANS